MINAFKKLLVVTNDPKDTISLSTLYGVYYGWCMDEITEPLGKINFAKELDLPKTSLGKNITGYRGLKLGDELEWYLE